MLDDVAELVAERNRLDAALARLVRAAELSQAPERDGQKSMASWLRGHCRLSGPEALRLVTAGPVRLHLVHWVSDGPDGGSTTGLRIRGPLPVVVGYAPLAQLAIGRLVRPLL